MPDRSCPRNWTSGCRCHACHGRLLERSRMRRAVAAVRAGRAPELRVPAAPARRRLEELRGQGLSILAISEATGVSVGCLQHLAVGDRRQVALVTRQALDAVAR